MGSGRWYGKWEVDLQTTLISKCMFIIYILRKSNFYRRENFPGAIELLFLNHLTLPGRNTFPLSFEVSLEYNLYIS